MFTLKGYAILVSRGPATDEVLPESDSHLASPAGVDGLFFFDTKPLNASSKCPLRWATFRAVTAVYRIS